MNRKILFLFFISLFGYALNAQHPVIAVQGKQDLSLHTSLMEAIDASIDGDTIYIPGGSFSINGGNITKKLHFYGSGHYPDTSGGVGQTIIQGDVFLRQGADSSVFEGIYFKNDILFQNEQNRFVELNGIKFKRCSFASLDLGGTYAPAGGEISANDVKNIAIIENVIRGNVDGDQASTVLFHQNIFDGSVADLPAGTVLSSNVFLKETAHVFSSLVGCTFKYNIILTVGNNIFHYTSNCIFQQNLFADDLMNDIVGNNTMINNIVGEPLENIFVNNATAAFDYNQDYRLSEECSGVGAGPGGTDIGIYGTDRPYLNGLTSNPYIHTISIPTTTDAEGTLNIEVKVSAQDY